MLEMEEPIHNVPETIDRGQGCYNIDASTVVNKALTTTVEGLLIKTMLWPQNSKGIFVSLWLMLI